MICNEDIKRIKGGEPAAVAELRSLIEGSFANLEFDEGPHKYYLHGEGGAVTELPSVSATTHRFANEFDADGIAERYAQKNGNTAEYWKEQWDYNNKIATTTGTLVHEFGESLGWIRSGHPERICNSCKTKYVRRKGWLVPTRDKEAAVVKFWDDMPENYHMVLPEAKVYNTTTVRNPYAGTFDLLMYYSDPSKPEACGCVLMDYKTNKDLYNEYNEKHGKMLKPCFDDLVDCPFSMYTLQLNLYQLALENIGVRVLGRRIVWLRDDGSYQIIKVPNIIDRIKESF